MVIGYLDIGGKNIAVEKQRRVIEQYAADNDFAVDMYVSETDIRNMEAGFKRPGIRFCAPMLPVWEILWR